MVKVFRSGEMLYALMEGGASWDNPIALHVVSLIWKITRSMERGLSVAVDPISGHLNIETQPLCYIGLRSWMWAMAKSTAGVHIKSLYGATITLIVWRNVPGILGKQLEIRLNGRGSTSIEVYAGHWGRPSTVSFDGKPASWLFVYFANTMKQ